MTEESIEKISGEVISVVEKENSKIYKFYAATTVPDRCPDPESKTYGDILTPQVLQDIANRNNNTNVLGGLRGAYRTVGLFHDRVYLNDQKLEEAGYVLPTAKVVPHRDIPGHYALEMEVEVNEMYVPKSHPDYTPDKIKYKIEKGAIGLSIEYLLKLDKNYPTKNIDGKPYRIIDELRDYQGVSFARANVIGNPTAVAIKESADIITLNETHQKDGLVKAKTMAETQEAKVKEQSETIERLQAEVKEVKDLQAKLKEAQTRGAEGETAVKELQAKIKELESNSIPAAEIKELLAAKFADFAIPNKNAKTKESTMNPLVKEVQNAIDKNDWYAHKHAVENVFVKQQDANNEVIRLMSERSSPGFDFEEHQTLQVKCQGSKFVVVPSAKTKDILDASSMAEGTYTQTNAMFADRYVAQITETFLMDDSFLKVIPKEQHVQGNDYYQWRNWTEFINTANETAAVNPNNTSVVRQTKNFEKLQTPIKEYRWGVEVSDFANHHSRQSVGDLLAIQIQRASEIVVQSMAADIFKEVADGTNNQFLGLEAVADATGNATLYGKTRSTANRLLTGTLADTYVTTSEGITTSVIRAGYTKVTKRGSNFSDLIMVTNPTQVRRLFDTQDNTAATYNSIIQAPVTLAGAPPGFGFNRMIIPHVDGMPIVEDNNCQEDAFYIVNINPNRGAVLVVSKPLGVRGLAKVGTTESAYVNFYGAFVYKDPTAIFLHDTLTTT